MEIQFVELTKFMIAISDIQLRISGTTSEKYSVSIIGARRCTEYGKKVTLEAAEFLALNGIPVISGMPKGIDSYANPLA